LKCALIDSWDELVLDNFTVLFPVFPILHAAPENRQPFDERMRRGMNIPLKVTTAAVNQDDEEEDWVEVGNWRSKADREAPGE